jgi:hypothetical protein
VLLLVQQGVCPLLLLLLVLLLLWARRDVLIEWCSTAGITQRSVMCVVRALCCLHPCII